MNMTVMEYEKIENYTRLFSVYTRGIESHLENEKPDKDYICNSLIYMKELLYNLTDSFTPAESTSSDLAASICDNCKKAWSSKTQAELDEHCRKCSVVSHFEGRC